MSDEAEVKDHDRVETRDGEDPLLAHWNENETFATSEATSRVSDVELLKVIFLNDFYVMFLYLFFLFHQNNTLQIKWKFLKVFQTEQVHQCRVVAVCRL